MPRFQSLLLVALLAASFFDISTNHYYEIVPFKSMSIKTNIMAMNRLMVRDIFSVVQMTRI